MTVIEKIKDEIERLLNEAPTWDDTIAYLTKVECFLDSLESEKPMNLEEEINRYLREKCSDDDEPGIHEIARHFAEWGYLRAAEKYNEIEYNRQRAEDSVPNDLEKAAEAFAFKSLDEVILYGCTLSGRRACFIAGAKWDREQMLKEAIGGNAYPNDGEIWVDLARYGYKFKEGEPCRIIIVKEGEK